MERRLTIAFTGEMLATIEFLAARRGVPVTDVIRDALSHEFWLDQAASTGRTVVSVGKYDREELMLQR